LETELAKFGDELVLPAADGIRFGGRRPENRTSAHSVLHWNDVRQMPLDSGFL
jgi:hypothetical protein